MKRILFAVLSLTTFIANAQKDFQGMAVYESKTSTAEFAKNFDGNKDMTPEMIPASKPNKNPPRETTKEMKINFFDMICFSLFILDLSFN